MAVLAFLFDWSGRSARAVFVLWAVLFWAAVLWLITAWTTGAFEGASPGAHWPLLAVGLTFLPYHAAVFRRLNDAGLPVELYWASLVPVLGLAALWVIGTRRPVRAYEPVRSVARQCGVWGASVAALLLSGSAFLALHRVPGVDMKPAFLPGDVLLVSRWRGDAPAPGDIAVFRHPLTQEVLARRIVALGGSQVALDDGRLIVDGVVVRLEEAGLYEEISRPEGPLQREPFCSNGPVGPGATCEKRARRETLANDHRHTILDTRQSPLDRVSPMRVPKDEVFVLGDNRDHARDSRVNARARGVGTVPLDAIIGRADVVLISPRGRSVLAIWKWRANRFMMAVE